MVCILFVALLLRPVCCEMNLDAYWTSWKMEFNKKYNNSGEEVFRRSVWQHNVMDVMKHNGEHHSFMLGLNHLSDLTAEEVNAKMNGLSMKNIPLDSNENFTVLSDSPVPDTLNWTEKGLVSPVQNQGMCGSCWAFSAVGALEGQMMKKSGRLVPLSVQNLVDCSVMEGNHGCKGGFMTNAFMYIIHNKGIDSDAFYPYTHQDGLCRYSPKGRAGFCSSFRILPRVNESVLLNTVAQFGPVSVGMNAKLPSFHRYKSVGVQNGERRVISGWREKEISVELLHLLCSRLCKPSELLNAVFITGYKRHFCIGFFYCCKFIIVL
ncbi:cathepsin S, ortholog 1 isoform X2 [Silurus meridionalis]|uniref:cathepsin S, ortholog 1 isoform X2 n=1 Tax=Silurus meridionalis TaxID=175797 RepID=UPI001EECBA18|nr:cathepsin S, ortholog 1 isoform X2 [Silurus meridionalis]